MTWIRMAQLLEISVPGPAPRTVINLAHAASRRSYLRATSMSHLLHIARPARSVQFVGLEDHDPIGGGADQPFGAQVAHDARHNWANGADGIGDFLLRHPGYKAASLLTGCGQVEQVAGHALAERAKHIA